jgi:hypothetical protein
MPEGDRGSTCYGDAPETAISRGNPTIAAAVFRLPSTPERTPNDFGNPARRSLWRDSQRTIRSGALPCALVG